MGTTLRFLSVLVVLVGTTPAIALPGDAVGQELNSTRGVGTSGAVIHLDQDRTTFEATMATELGNGNRLVDVEVLTISGTGTRFSGVFYPVGGTIHTLIHGTDAEWQSFLDTVNPLDGRWLDLEVGFHGTAGRLYSAIFLEDGDDYNYLVDSNMTDAELQTFMEDKLREGFALIDFEAYTIPGDGSTAFGAIWVKDPNQPMTHLYHDLEFGDLQDLWDPLAGRIIDFERYHSDFFGEERFAIVVANHPGGEWYIDTWMTDAEVATTNGTVSDGDTHLIDLHAFEVGGAARYSGVWGENWKSLNEVAELTPFVNDLALTTDLNDLIEEFEVDQPHGEGIVGFYAKNLRTQQAVGYRKDEPFYLGSATKTAAHIRLWMQIEDGHFAPDDEGTEVQFSLSTQTGAPHYVEDRGWPGFSSGTPEHSWCTGGDNAGASCDSGADCDSGVCTPQNNLGQLHSIDRYDLGMMRASDNAATSLLVDDSTIGLSHDTTNLNEWLSGIDGVSRGWGLVTSINDLDRLIHWQGQHTPARKNDTSFFLAPSHTFGPFQRKDYKACTVVASTPIACVPASTCTRCSDDSDCQSPEFCVPIRDPWTDLATFMGIPIGALPPDPDWTVGHERYYAMGLNSATPRAYVNLLEKFWDDEFLTDKTAALDNMLQSSQLANDFGCRLDANGDSTCDPGEGWDVWAAKGGSKGSSSDGTSICVDTGIFEMTGGGGSDVVAMAIMMRENSAPCGISGGDNDLRNWWDGPVGDAMARAVTVDLTPSGTIPPTYALRGDQIEIALAVDNLGGAISGSFSVRIFASEDQNATGGWFIDNVVVPSVAGNSSYSAGIIPLALPQSLPEAEYWLFARADSLGEVGEYDETPASNIARLSGGKLYVVPPCPDEDLDGYSTCNPLCIPDGTVCGDCGPTDPTIYPGAVEICDGIDQDCDSIVDNNIPTPLTARRIEYDDPQPYHDFGQALANLGDLNGDSIDDFVVGMPGGDVDGVGDAGVARVISGADLATICDAVLPSSSTSDSLGESVAAAGGDLNGNGQNDFVVGVPHYDGTGANTGAVAVFNGPDCAFVRLLEDPAMDASDRLGHAVASIGDVDNDAVPDIAASSLYNDLSGGPRGAITVFSGAGGTVLYTTFDPAGVADDLGASLVGPGDLTGDGIPDVAAGAPETDVSGSANGAVYVFSGADGAYVERFTDPTSESYSRLGLTLAALGDLGSDGVSELAAGQAGDIVGGSRIGSVAIFEGSSGVVVERLINPLPDSGSSDGFPAGIAPIADMSGDGVTDVLVGADGDDDLADDAGSVFVFDSVTGAVIHHLFDPAGTATDRLGTTVISLGDISGDGVADFAAGAPQADDIEANQAGHVVVFVLEEDCDNDGYSPYAGDCADMDPAISPLATEVCDTVDNDCDGLTDEDGDGDGFGVCDDCDDHNARVNPDGVEICNGLDDNCNGSDDESPLPGNPDGDTATGACFDCDETDPAINIGRPETCNLIDDDCSGIPDDGFPKLVSTRFSLLPSGEGDDELATDVAAIGDVNFDGVPDYVAGAPLADLSGANQGAAAVFDGATGSLVCVATPGTQNSEQSGTSVAGVGDVNGDGVADFAMGAPFRNAVLSDDGAIDVINGDDCTLIRELTDSSAMGNDRLGLSVAGIGDLTGDGIGEIAGGASWAQTPYGNQAGAVLVWDGATGAQLFKLTDPHTGSNRLGSSVAGIDDVNADGIPDIVAGAPYDDGVLGGDVGSVVVFSGADGSLIHKMFDPDGTGSDWLGWSVAGVADLTGDAVPDVLAGAPNEDTGGPNAGAILVFSGADGTLAQRVPLNGVAATTRFGTSVAVIGDLTGDLLPEFAGGAPLDDTEGTNAGRVVVIDGADFSVLHDITLTGSSAESNLGIALDGIDDLNGDGEPELLLGQPRQHTQEDADVGRVVVWSYGSDCDDDGVGALFLADCDDQDALRRPGLPEICDGIDNDCDVSIDEDEDGDGDDACADCAPAVPTISTSMTEVCNTIDDNCNLQADEGVDADGDSFTTPCDCDDDDPDVNASIVEICNTIDDNCDGRIDEGFASPLDQRRILDPEMQVGDDVGTALAIVGDVDADGALDFVVGVPGDNVAANGAGSGLLVSGATLAVICRLVDPDAMTADSLGRSAAGVGDVTGDGTPDIALGSRSDDGAGQASGAVQIFDGATCAWVRELKDPGAEANDFFGSSIAAIGDVTGDTVSDIAVGANDDHENGYVDVGSVSVFDGSSGALLYKSLDPHGRSNDQLGASVSALGDVDFDGIPDFAAGSPYDDVSPRGGAGSVTLFSGIDGSFIRSISDPTAVANESVGHAVAAAGDMNGDGVPDLIAGAPGEDTGATNAGAVLAFSGADGSLIRRFVDSSPLTSADLGFSIAAAGDLDGDGITEIVAGGPSSSRTGTAAGEVVLFDGATGAVLHRFTDTSSLTGDDLGHVVAAADLNGGGLEILAGAPSGAPGGLNSAGYATLFTLDADCDGDGSSPLADCDDADGGTTGAPGPAEALTFSDATTLEWSAPADPGLEPGTLVYDVVRSGDPSDFATAATCVESNDDADTTATDTDTPDPGALFAYLVRVESLCGAAADPGRSVAQCP